MSKVKLGEVAIEHKETCKGNKDGYPIVGLEHLVPEEVTLTAWDEGSDNTFTKMFRKGNVLFGRRRAYLKKAAVAPFDGICSGDITVIEAIPDRILPMLLPFIIQNDELFDFAVGKSAGSLSPRVKWEHLKNYEFELPDMDKQRELAELLWAMDATKKSYHKLIAATDELVKSQFMEQFGDPNSNPLSWPTATIGEICDIKSGTTLPAAKENEGGEIAYIKVADMNIPGNEKYITTSTKFVSATTAGNGVFPIGTVVFPKNGAAVATNKKRITHVPTCVDLNTMGVTPRIKIDEQYLYLWFQLLDLDSISLVSAIPQISAKTMGAQVIMLPPLDLQEQFAAFVRQSDKSKFAVLSCSNLNLSSALASQEQTRLGGD